MMCWLRVRCPEWRWRVQELLELRSLRERLFYVLISSYLSIQQTWDKGGTGKRRPSSTTSENYAICVVPLRCPQVFLITGEKFVLPRMDAKDVRIFCEIAFKNPGMNEIGGREISPLGIGRSLGLDEKTVRVRVKRMEQDGFIKKYQAIPSFALFGLKTLASYRFESLNILTKHNIIDYIQRVPHVVDAYDYIGPFLAIRFAGTSQDDIQTVADSVASRFELSQFRLGDESVLFT